MLAVMLAVLSAAPVQDPDVVRAVTLYELAEFAPAQTLLEEIVQRPALSAQDRTLALGYLAATHHAQGHAAEAERALEQLVAFDRKAVLDPNRFDPALIALHQKVLARTQPPKEEAVAVTQPEAPSAPPAATVREQQPPPIPKKPKVLPIALLAGGAALAVLGAAGELSVQGRVAEWQAAGDGAPLSFTRDQARFDRTLHPLSIGAMAVGVGAATAGVWMLATGSSDAPRAAVVPVPGEGAAVLVEGRF